MNSLKQVIVNAVVKVSEDPKYGAREYATSEDARRDFIKALIAELFPECPDCVLPEDEHSPAVVVVAEVDGGGEPAKEKKKRAPKKKAEAPAEEVPAPVEAPVAEAAPVKEKKKRAPKKKEEAPVEEVAVVEAAPVEAAAPEKKKRGPKAKAEGAAVNHPKKLNKTEENKVKGIAKELKVEAKDEDVLAYLNGLSAEEYAAKSFEEHVRALLTPKETAVAETVAKRGLLVEFNGKDFWVDPETKKVYATNGPVDEHIGHVGMLEYEDMEIPDHLPEDLEEIVN